MTDKVKIYLDTNMIHDYFVNQARSIRQGQEPKVPEKFKFILASKEKIEFITSFLTKAEIVRELISAHGIDYKEFQPVWNDFIENIYCTYVDNFRFNDDLVGIASRLPMKLRTMINFMHLFIAIELSAYIVSGDKDMINKIKSIGIYEHAINYQELRQIVEGGVN